MSFLDFTSLQAFAGHPLLEKLGWVLLHFLWEGALVAGALALALTLMRRRPASERYGASLAALAVMAVLPVVTWLLLAPAVPAEESSSSLRVIMLDEPSFSASLSSSSGLTVLHSDRLAATTLNSPSPDARGPLAAVRAWLGHRAAQSAPLVAWGWLLGVALLAVRTAGGWVYVRRLRRDATPAAERWQRRFRALVREMGLPGSARGPQLLVSGRASGPAAVGWWRPAVLVPTGFLTGLPPGQVEAILRHELAHIRRHDYLVGLAQAAVETLLFYHPAVWWVSGRVRTLREHCCDDAAARSDEDGGLAYARALAALEDWRSGAPLAPAASDGSLLARIRRVTGQGGPQQQSWVGSAVAALTALLVLGACAAGSTVGQIEGALPDAERTAASAASADSVRRAAPPSPAPASPPPAPAPPDTVPAPRVHVLHNDTTLRSRVRILRSDTTARDLHALTMSISVDSTAWPASAKRRFLRLKRLHGGDRFPFDSLTTFTLRRADSTLFRADSALSRLSVRFDSMDARFSDPEALDNFEVRFFDPEAVDSLQVRHLDDWAFAPADTIFTDQATRAKRRALKQTANRLDARADMLEEAGRDETARALRKEADRLRMQREQIEERIRESSRQVRKQMKQARKQMERAREQMERAREQMEQAHDQMEEGGTAGVRSWSGGRETLDARERREVREARLYVRGPVVRLDGRRLFAFHNTAARSDETLAFYHPGHGLFVFSDRPFEKAVRAGQMDGPVARFSVNGKDVEVRSQAERPLVRGGERPAYVYHNPDYEPESFGAMGEEYEGPWFGTGHVPGSEGGSRAYTTGD